MRDSDVRNRPRQGTSIAKQPLVVRHRDEHLQLDEVLERLERLETASEPSENARKAGEAGQITKLDLRTIVAIAAILLSVAGYVIEDARSTSRQQAEIEATKVRVTNLERIASANTEARIRSEVELGELRQGQSEIKELLRAHDNETIQFLRKKSAR